MGFFKKQVTFKRVPNHIAFIIDGNGRWAKEKGLPRTIGHKYGVEAVKVAIEHCLEFGIKNVSFYTFSTENWKRPKQEVDEIFELLRNYINEDVEELNTQGVRLITSGELDKLPNDIKKAIENAKEKTKDNNKLIVNMAINYGGRQEIIRAVNNILKEGKKQINLSDFENYLYTKDMLGLDFIVRTSGEQRLSNFMPYQSAYSEFFFPKVYWPAFDKKQFIKALKEYENRTRRFGGLK